MLAHHSRTARAGGCTEPLETCALAREVWCWGGWQLDAALSCRVGQVGGGPRGVCV